MVRSLYCIGDLYGANHACITTCSCVFAGDPELQESPAEGIAVHSGRDCGRRGNLLQLPMGAGPDVRVGRRQSGGRAVFEPPSAIVMREMWSLQVVGLMYDD